MATLAAANVSAILLGYPVWQSPDISPFLGDDPSTPLRAGPPRAAPSIVNAGELKLPSFQG
jgi:hypothetical protein